MKRIYEVNVADGLITPLTAQQVVPADHYGNTGAFTPQLQLLGGSNILHTRNTLQAAFGEGETLAHSPILGDVQELLYVTLSKGLIVAIALTPGGAWIANFASATTTELVELDIETAPNMPAHVAAAWEITTGLDFGFDWLKFAEAPQGPVNPTSWWTTAIIANKLYLYQQGLGAIYSVQQGNANNVVRIYKFNPTFIAGTYEVFQWTLHTELLINGSEPTSITLALEPTGTQITLALLHKTHIAERFEYDLTNFLRNLFGAGVIAA